MMLEDTFELDQAMIAAVDAMATICTVKYCDGHGKVYKPQTVMTSAGSEMKECYLCDGGMHSFCMKMIGSNEVILNIWTPKFIHNHAGVWTMC